MMCDKLFKKTELKTKFEYWKEMREFHEVKDLTDIEDQYFNEWSME